jgi:glycosyltransferase involved in cell wall biosynthesis
VASAVNASARQAAVDVVIPTYGSADYLPQAIESVLGQSYERWRLRIFDNGPGGGAAASAMAPYLSDPRVEAITTGSLLPQTENWNRCIQVGDAPYVAMLHDDDYWDADVLGRRVAFLEAHPGCALVFSSMRDVDEHGRTLIEVPHRLPEGLHEPLEFVPLLLEEQLIGSPTPLVRRAAYEAVGPVFSEQVRRSADWDMWLRIALRHPVGYLAVRDCSRRIHASSYTSAASRGIWGQEEIAVVDRFEQLVERELPQVEWPLRARRRRRASGHLIWALDALEEGDRRGARSQLAAAVRTHPPAVLDPRVGAGIAALALGGRGSLAISRLRDRQRRRRVRLHLRELRRWMRDETFRVVRG